MSMALMVQAMGLKVGNPLRKLVLLKLADNASDLGECWPSYAHIAEQCEISVNSVRGHIKALAEAGLLRITPRFNEAGQGANLYRLTLSATPPQQMAPPLPANGTPPANRWQGPLPADGRAPPQQMAPESVNEPVIEPKERSNAPDDQKTAAVQKTAVVQKPAKAGSKNPGGAAPLDFSRWPGVPSAAVLADWQAVRKAKGALLTQTAVNRMARELTRASAAGMGVDDCLALCCLKGWVGFEFDWAVNAGAVAGVGAGGVSAGAGNAGKPGRHHPGAVTLHVPGGDDFFGVGEPWPDELAAGREVA